jgi:uncharacterized protein
MDTSALAKRYILETGSRWIKTQVKPSSINIVMISALTTVELFSLLFRHQRLGNLQPQSAQKLKKAFLSHVKKQYSVFKIDELTLQQARELVQRHPLRALDAIQLACAIEALSIIQQNITFISSDKNLLKAAIAEGFLTDDPNSHPLT